MSLTVESFSNDAALETMRLAAIQKRRCDEENSVYRNIWKRAKADGQPIEAMKATLKALKLDPDEVVATLRAQLRLMSLRRIPVSRETLFDGMDLHITDKSQHEDDIWSAEDKGYQAGRHGAKIEDCPYDAGTELFVAWESHWQKGQGSIARELGPTGTVAAPRRGRRAVQTRIPGTEEQDRPKAPRKAAAKKAARAGRRSAGRRNGSSGPRIAAEDGQPVY